ncbi:MAG: response regulator transcription factor [Terracidiphilus sp.]
MSSTHKPNPIRIGLVAGEPIQLEGMTSMFELGPEDGQSALFPVIGSIEELLRNPAVDYLVVDLSSPSDRLETLAAIRRTRPSLRFIVIGPEDNDELVMDAIMAGARAYLDMAADPQLVRQAIEVVVSGSIWAPRRLLSKLVDRLLPSLDRASNGNAKHLTDREQDVLELILKAHSNREIARELGIEERTVKAHVGRLMRKTGAENRIDLSMRAINGSLPLKAAAR